MSEENEPAPVILCFNTDLTLSLMKKFYIIPITLAFAALLSCVGVAAAASKNHERILDNGLKIIVIEDHRSPVVVSMLWYRAGSIDEFNGTTGVAHVLEHMMFKGTRSVPPGEFSRRIAAAGGKDNAFTGRDYTAYFQQLHKSRLAIALKLEADRMNNLILSSAEFSKEIKVVMEERRWRTDDQPQSLVEELLMNTAFSAHPYQRPIIGWMNDLENMTVMDAKDWYHRWYAPNNAILVIVGDIVPHEAFTLAQRYFGKIKSRLLPVRKHQSEPPQSGTRRAIVKAPSEQAYLMMGYHVPTLRDVENDWEPYALSILAGILDGNAAARLNRSLVREQKISSAVSVDYDGIARGPGMFVIEAVPSQGKTVEEVEHAIRDQIAMIISNGVTDDELSRVKAQVISSNVYQRDSMFYQALLTGQMEISGLSYDSIDRQMEKLKQVSSDQVRQVATQYLVDDNLSVAVLDPQPVDKKTVSDDRPSGHITH
jgi:zinc protease